MNMQIILDGPKHIGRAEQQICFSLLLIVPYEVKMCNKVIFLISEKNYFIRFL